MWDYCFRIKGGRTWAVKEKLHPLLYLNILAEEGVRKELLRFKHTLLLLLDHLKTQALNIKQIKARMFISLTLLSCQHCSLLLSAQQRIK